MQDRETVNRRLLEEYNCYPVYLSDELADSHYNGKFLFPLTLPLPTRNAQC